MQCSAGLGAGVNLMPILRSARRTRSYKVLGATAKQQSQRNVDHGGLVLVGEAVTVGIGLVLDRIYPAVSLPVSLTLFFAILWFALVLSVRLTEPKSTKGAKHAT